MSLRLVTAPTDEPVTVAEAKARLRIDTSASDDDLAAMLLAARQEIDGVTGRLGRALLTQTWELGLPYFPAGPIALPLPPCQSIVSVKYRDSLDVEQTIDASDYRLILRGDAPSIIEPAAGKSWPAAQGWSGWPSDVCDSDARWYGRTDPVTIRFVCGWATPDDVPAPLRTWIMARAGAFYAQPEAAAVQVQVNRVPFYDAILAPYRVWG